MQLGKTAASAVSSKKQSSRKVFAAAFLTLMLLATTVPVSSYAADFGDDYSATDPSPGPTDNCSPSDAPLTNQFAENPCNWTKDNESIDYAQNYRAGAQFIKHVSDWWSGKMLPDLKKMTKQIHSSIIDQTRQLGSMMDTQAITDVSRTLQQIELQSKKSMVPNENTCTAGTPLMTLGHTFKASSGITQSYVFGQAARSSGIRLPGDVRRLERIARLEAEKNGSAVVGDATAAAPVSNILSPAADTRERFEQYCKYFKDLQTNAGKGIGEVCVENVSDAARAMPDADIDVEGFLLKDTIDMSKPEEQAAAKAILNNLLEPKIIERIPDGGDNVSGVLKTDQGRQSVLQRQNLSALRKIAYEVVASMIARRTAIPGTKENFNVTVTKPGPGNEDTTSAEGEGLGPGAGSAPTGTSGGSASCQQAAQVATHQTPRNNTVYGTANPVPYPQDGAPCGNYDRFIYTVGKAEGGGNYGALNSIGYMGKYQFGEIALTDLGYCTIDKLPGAKCTIWTPKAKAAGINTYQDFLSNGPFQERVMREHLASGIRYHKRLGLTRFLGQNLNGVHITSSGMLAASHLAGPGGLKCYLTRDQGYCKKLRGISLDSNLVPMDANNIRISMYQNLFNGYTTPFSPAWPPPGAVITTSPMANEMAESGGNTPAPGTTEVVAVNVSNQIADIRKKAGVSDYDISPIPSYNEIMVAQTKERFFNADYYTSMANDLGAIRQEQTVVNSYISIQLQDIYRLQEQINMLLAARASMKLNNEYMPDLNTKLPVTSP